MPTETMTPELIRAVFEYQEKREQEIKDAASACRPKCYVSAGIYLSAAEGSFVGYAQFEPSIRNDGRPKWRANAEEQDFDAVVDELLRQIAAYAVDMFGTDVERMALAIIQIKHRDGTVTDRALRMADFSQEAIEQIHERAALLANEMSDGKPFEVEFVGAGNHAEPVAVTAEEVAPW